MDNPYEEHIRAAQAKVDWRNNSATAVVLSGAELSLLRQLLFREMRFVDAEHQDRLALLKRVDEKLHRALQLL